MALRLRLKFQKHILSESQQLDGLKRSWILVDRGDHTISDLILHLIDAFNLYDSCPNGILLTMDGFVLPPFESVGMLKDAEVICVKRKGAKLVDVIQGNERETDFLEHNVEQKQQLIPVVQLANGDFLQETGGYQSETDEDSDEAQTDVHEENTAHVHVPAKKRKASEEPNVDAVHAKKRKLPKEPKISNSLNKGGEATISPYSQPNKSGQSRSTKRKKIKRQLLRNVRAAEKEKTQSLQEEEKADSGSEKEQISNADNHQQDPDEDSSAEDEVVPVVSRSARRKKAKRRWIRAILAAEEEQMQSSQDKQKAGFKSGKDKSLNMDKEKSLQEEEEEADSGSEKEQISNADDHQHAPEEDSSAGDEVVHVASRSARRKKAKRQRIRAILAAEEKQMQSPQDKQRADSGSDKDNNLKTDNRQQEPDEDEDSDTDGEAVPVTIRPGHILFASPGKVKEVEQQKEAKESFNWSGTMNKRKGQKWGSQLQTTSKWNENGENPKWNENRTPHENQSATVRNGHRSPKEKQSKSWQNDHTVPERDRASEKAPADNASIDYEKLLPLTDSPVKGDIIAYRLVELSSSFCPELTTFRVGKVSWFDSESNKIMLSPLPQYPFEFKKSANDDDDDEDEDEDELPGTSLYNEDGSLEIEFQSLVDVRVVERGELASAVVVQHKANGAPASGSGWNTETSKGKGSSTQAWPIKVNGTRGNKSASAPASGKQTEASSSNQPSPQPQPTSINITGANNSAPRPNTENGSSDAWEEITAALSAKKAELSKEDKWSKNQSGAKRPWSYRAMRNGALGPTLALLRTQNGPQAN